MNCELSIFHLCNSVCVCVCVCVVVDVSGVQCVHCNRPHRMSYAKLKPHNCILNRMCAFSESIGVLHVWRCRRRLKLRPFVCFTSRLIVYIFIQLQAPHTSLYKDGTRDCLNAIKIKSHCSPYIVINLHLLTVCKSLRKLAFDLFKSSSSCRQSIVQAAL